MNRDAQSNIIKRAGKVMSTQKKITAVAYLEVDASESDEAGREQYSDLLDNAVFDAYFTVSGK